MFFTIFFSHCLVTQFGVMHRLHNFLAGVLYGVECGVSAFTSVEAEWPICGIITNTN